MPPCHIEIQLCSYQCVVRDMGLWKRSPYGGGETWFANVQSTDARKQPVSKNKGYEKQVYLSLMLITSVYVADRYRVATMIYT